MAGLTMREVPRRNSIPAGLKNRFRILGPRPRTELTDYLRRARIAVVPSRWENFPNTCVEAMVSGLPVIATREGGMAEMIDDGRTGWLAAATTPLALEETLRRALQNAGESASGNGTRGLLRDT